jgi:hypothetical protein
MDAGNWSSLANSGIIGLAVVITDWGFLGDMPDDWWTYAKVHHHHDSTRIELVALFKCIVC